ncbi:lacI family transcriptional regulator [Nonlabens tegetincola]|uniref:LacI family transcriptional regulator n=1 Tax=Nonlabens tegetincola TaxID=323273 RepID=A0A090QQR4_9FLAO|nr:MULTISPECIES: LacI family DNA-binding transcriptional regulator [Nonlabens]ARN71869.1 LacI family transcriptional regulator [Nonlabens tegetincola]MEE2801651.1 LacI family DNA-binding transcriptional regulator [Bacteroidota bacterium]GAK97831.1 lacI family transcriptional regulator [Nonlabens tegetincola]
MAQKLTLKKIAQDLKVSISTVSKALRDSYEISEETRKKIQEYAKQYNYKPNSIALSLKNQKTKKIGIIIPEIVHHFFATVISGVEHVANEKGYQVIICLSGESFDKEVVNMEMLANGSIDGFILSLSKETMSKQDFHHLREVINQGMPIVMFDRVADDIPGDKIIIDDVTAASEATDFLMRKAKKNVGILSTVDYVNVGRLRTQGYSEALMKRGVEVNQDLILKIEDIDHCDELIEKFIDNNPSLDGIVAVNELFAVTASKILLRKGKRIPDDVAIVAFTDGMLSKYSNPSLTTIGQNGYEMGGIAAAKLIDRLEQDQKDEERYETVIVKTSLIERESTP